MKLTSWLTPWLTALRLARREVRRAKGRSALVIAMIALPIFLQIKLEYDALQTGLSLAPLSLTMFAVAILAGRRAGKRRAAAVIRTGFAMTTVGKPKRAMNSRAARPSAAGSRTSPA